MKKIVCSMLAACTLLVSCEQELDIVNPNQPTAAVFWQSSNDAVAGINAVYSTLHRGPLSRWQWFLFTTRSDVGYSVSPDTRIVNNMDRFLITDYNFGHVVGVWHDNYVGIFRANQVLANVPGINMDEELKQRVLGEARFMRAFFYYTLVTLWGNVPLQLEPSTPVDLPGNATPEEVWAQIELDLRAAAEALPIQYTGNNIGRATRGAAYALLAKAHMQQREWNEAAEPLQWLVEGQGSEVYGLVENYRHNFLSTTENNIESVFEWQYAVNPLEWTDNDVQTPDHNVGTSLAQFIAPIGVGWSDAEVRRWVIHEFLEERTVNGERDPRLEASILFDSTDVRGPEFTMVYGQTFAQRYGTNNQRAWFRKPLNDFEPGRTAEGYRSPNNYRFIRYADVLLMYAETLNQLGRTQEAYQYVDRVRQRAELAPLSEVRPGMNQAQFQRQIEHERVTELVGEGHRWPDLARWGYFEDPQKLNELIQRDPAFSTFVIGQHNFLPLPQRDVDINPNLNQNPGY